VSSAWSLVLWVAAAVAAVSLADLFAPTAVVVGVFALAIIGVAGACLRGMRVGR
jgi:hypothetical protein